jgi:arylsulfatase A-like enzyme
MNERILRRCWHWIVAGPLLALPVPSVALAAPPNVVVILADDVGWGDLRANNPASLVPTPNLDLLAQNGMRFTNAHSPAAHCAPTRYAALTGNYQWRGRRGWGTWNHQEPSQILPGQKTVADILLSAGYNTGFVGKLHMGGDFRAKGSDEITRDPAMVDYGRPFGDGPLAHGFRYSFALLEGMQAAPYAYFENDALVGDANALQTWLAGRYGRSRVLGPGIGMPYWNSSQVGPDTLARAIAFLDTHKATYGATRPFFLHYATPEAHSPYTSAETLAGQPVRGATGLCARQDVIYQLDLAVGTLIAKLRGDGVLQDTLFVFTSDNGGGQSCGQDSSGPAFNGNKGEIQEGGHRVPFVVAWGDAGTYTIPAGTVRTQPIGVQDIAATLAAIAQVPLAADQALDSFNLLPVWLGLRGDEAPVRDHLIAEARYEGEVRVDPRFAYYEGNWKLVIRRTGSAFTPIALYDLAVDPGEVNDVLAIAGPRVLQMFERFQARYAGPRSAPVGG